MDSDRIHIKNKRAYFDYEMIDKFTAGIQITGTEIKSIRQGKASINEAFCVFKKDELYVRNMHIAEYVFGNVNNHDPVRTRKLLLTKKELTKLKSRVTEKGLTIVPLHLFISQRGFAKLEIGLGRGKKTHDKRESIKERDSKREIDRVKKSGY